MAHSKDRARRIARLAVHRIRKVLAKRNFEALGVATMCAIAFWLGIERGLLDGSELCVAPQEWAPDPPECFCERGRSRWRYGRCDEHPVDWADADLIVEAAMARTEPSGADGGVTLVVHRVLRGSWPEGGRIALHHRDVEQLAEAMNALGGDTAPGRFFAMFRIWETGTPRLQFLRRGYYAVAGESEMATVRLRPNDIQLFHAGTGEPYDAPPETAPLPDFEFSLRLAEPSR